MTEYYRVRSQKQWDWLMQWFEKQDKNIMWSGSDDSPTELNGYGWYGNKTVVEKNDSGMLFYADLYSYQQFKSVFDYIEASQMMEESKMEDYVTIKGEDLKNIEMFRGDESKGNLEELWDVNKVNISKPLLYPKVRMSVAEKKEFDELKRHRGTVYGALDMIEDDYPKLYTRLFGNSSHEGESKAQLEFARAWADESLIEVIPDKKWYVLVPKDCQKRKYLMIDEGNVTATYAKNTQLDTEFSAEDIKHYGLEDETIYKREEVSE